MPGEGFTLVGGLQAGTISYQQTCEYYCGYNAIAELTA